MFQAVQIISNNSNTKELEYKKKFIGKMGFYSEEAKKVLANQKLIGSYRNDKIGLLLKRYQVKTNGMNKP